MIIKRIASAISRQDWFQVTIEVLIVIVGIFLGLQVQAWYEDRANRIEEQKYLNRLHIEVTEALRPAIGLMKLRTERYNELLAVIEMLRNNDDGDIITSRQCYAIHSSSLVVSTAGVLPTMDELLSAGKVAIISNEEVRSALSLYNTRLALWAGMSGQTQNSFGHFLNKYPDFFELDLTMNKIPTSNEDINRYNHNCYIHLMKDSLHFKNDLVNRAAMLKSYIDIYHVSQVDALKVLDQALDAALNISHDPIDEEI